MERRRALIAGATGYLGGEVVKVLHEAGYWVRALARDEARLAVRDACDDVFVGEATKPSTLSGAMDGIDVVFSSIGLRSFSRKPTIWDVDCQANLNLVELAERAGVRDFAFASLFRGDELRSQLAVAEARERVVDALRASKMRATVVRPNGFFNDMREMFDMAKRGRVWLVGSGAGRFNPIHGADLATATAEAILRAANTLTLAQLDDDAALDARAARNIVAARDANGPFDSVIALDDVPYVGQRAFSQLLSYAERQGFAVPTIVFTPAELVAIADDARELTAA